MTDTRADPKALQEKLRLLGVDYAEQLPGKIAQIQEIWKNLQTGWDQLACQTLHRMAHGLSGSGALFGFSAISKAARDLDCSLVDLAEGKTPATAVQRTNIQGLMEELSRAAALKQNFLPGKASSTGMGVSTAAKSHSSKLIFIVEDELDVAQELALQLGYFGYEVRVYHQLSVFRQAIEQNPQAIVLMDISFPENGRGGCKTMQEVQQHQVTPIRVMFVTSHDQISSRLEAARAGGLAYFTKPLNLGSLIDRLDDMTSSITPQPFRVLIVDDSAHTARYHAALLEQAGMSVNIVTDPLEIMQPLIEFDPDLVLLDLYMPQCNGLELAQIIRQLDKFVGTPIVFLSSEANLDKQLHAMSLGADDFLVKPIAPQHLILTLANRIHRHRVLCSLMVRDSLTGLLNHTAIKEQLNLDMARARRTNTPLSCAMIDIDHFKRVNDTYGHATGDRVLKNIARLLRQRLRETDVVGRYGGEEFTVIMSATDAAAAATVMNDIREDFSRLAHVSEGREFFITFSCGVADMSSTTEGGQLGEAADRALYEAKHTGRNKVVMARI